LSIAARLEKTYIAALERGERNPSLVTQMQRLAGAGVTLDRLIAEAQREAAREVAEKGEELDRLVA